MRPVLKDADIPREQACVDGAWIGEGAAAVADPAAAASPASSA